MPDIHERMAALEARHAELDQTMAQHQEESETHLRDIYAAINGLRQDIYLAKGGARAVAWLGGIMVMLIGAAWAVYAHFNPVK